MDPVNKLPSESVPDKRKKEKLTSEATLASLAISALENFTGEPVRRLFLSPLETPNQVSESRVSTNQSINLESFLTVSNLRI